MADTLFFVSKRLQRAVAALICLILAQSLVVAAGNLTAAAPTSVRVAITR